MRIALTRPGNLEPVHGDDASIGFEGGLDGFGIPDEPFMYELEPARLDASAIFDDSALVANAPEELVANDAAGKSRVKRTPRLA